MKTHLEMTLDELEDSIRNSRYKAVIYVCGTIVCLMNGWVEACIPTFLLGGALVKMYILHDVLLLRRKIKEKDDELNTVKSSWGSLYDQRTELENQIKELKNGS